LNNTASSPLDLIWFRTMNKRTNEAIGSSTAGFAPAVSSEPTHQQNEQKNFCLQSRFPQPTPTVHPRTSYVQGKIKSLSASCRRDVIFGFTITLPNHVLQLGRKTSVELLDSRINVVSWLWKQRNGS
jgi:hypothetical protein